MMGRKMLMKAGKPSGAWNISTAKFVRSHTLDAQSAYQRGLIFKSDGSSMYILGDVGSGDFAVREYALATPWNVASASYLRQLVIPAVALTGLFISADGLRMYLCSGVYNQDNSVLYQYALGTAWNISTASFVRSTPITVASEANLRGVSFSPDGSGFYTAEGVAWFTYYQMSTPWDISTATLVTSFSGLSGRIYSIYFSPMNDRVYGTGVAVSTGASSTDEQNAIYYKGFAPPTSTSAPPDGGSSFLTANGNDVEGHEPTDLFFKPDGTRAYVKFRNSPSQLQPAIYEYSVHG